MSAECERVFSEPKRTTTDNRNKLKDVSIEAVQRGKDWLKKGLLYSELTELFENVEKWSCLLLLHQGFLPTTQPSQPFIPHLSPYHPVRTSKFLLTDSSSAPNLSNGTDKLPKTLSQCAI